MLTKQKGFTVTELLLAFFIAGFVVSFVSVVVILFKLAFL